MQAPQHQQIPNERDHPLHFLNLGVLQLFNFIIKQESLLYNPCKPSSNTSILLQSSKAIIDQIRILLRITNTNLYQLFQEKDPDKTGILTFLEFKNQLRKLNLGLTNQQLNTLSQLCHVDNKGFINWEDFVKKVQIKEINQRIIERSKTRLEQFRDDMYSFMLSPKEAFRQFNTEQNGQLTFNQFFQLIENLSVLSSTPTMPYQIIKDLFDLIDIRKDGVIDMKEWLHSLKIPECLNKNIGVSPTMVCNNTCQVRSLSTNGRLKSLNELFVGKRMLPQYQSRNNDVHKRNRSIDLTKQYFMNSVSWEMESDHDKIILLLGKNRRAIADAFKTLEITEGKVTKERCVQVMQQLAYSQGVDYKKFNWWQFVKAAEKEGVFDYNFFLVVLKERCSKIVTHPKQAI